MGLRLSHCAEITSRKVTGKRDRFRLAVSLLPHSFPLRVSDPFLYSYDRYRDYLKGTWKEVAGPGSGQFYSLGPHLIDQALHCFGRPERVTAFIENIRGMGDEAVDDDVTIISLTLTRYTDGS